nr:MAG TPA: hypothetical protein [Bacteriophage sp.]DAT29048.1 MAG TPA: hypothetical protein [Caudoviricetes sp.]
MIFSLFIKHVHIHLYLNYTKKFQSLLFLLYLFLIQIHKYHLKHLSLMLVYL